MKNKRILIKSVALFFGFLGMTFSGLNWHFGIAAWIAPICLLYYARNSKIIGFVVLFVSLFVAGYISQTCNNLANLPSVNIINGLSYGLVYTIIYLVDRLLYNKGKGFCSTLIFPSIIVLFEFLISLLIGAWGIVAHTQYSFSLLVQLSSITGLYGISFIVIWFGSVVNWIIENNYSSRSIRQSSFIYGGIFILIIVYGIIRNTFIPSSPESVKVAAIIGDTDIHSLVENEQSVFLELTKEPKMKIPERFFATEETINNQVANTIEAAKAGAKIIVWSEDALILNRQQTDTLIERIKDISKAYNAYILPAFLEHNSSVPKPFNNKSILITPKGEIAWQYLKSHLHPLAEVPIINRGNSSIPYFDTEYGRIGNVICYDMDFPAYIQQAGNKLIDIMLVPAYDWEEITPLHAHMACFEAIQNGFSMIRPNGKGLNLVTDSKGNIIAELDTFLSKSKILYAELPLRSTKTIYSKTGNIFVYLVIIFLLVALTLKIIKK